MFIAQHELVLDGRYSSLLLGCMVALLLISHCYFALFGLSTYEWPPATAQTQGDAGLGGLDPSHWPHSVDKISASGVFLL